MISNRNLIFTMVCLTTLSIVLFFIQPDSSAGATSALSGLWVVLFVFAKITAGIVSCVFLLALLCARPWRALEKTPPANSVAGQTDNTTNKPIKSPLAFQK